MLGLALYNPLKWLQNAFNGNGKVHLDLINSLLWLCWFRTRFSKSNNCQNNADKEQIIPSGSHPKCFSSDEFLPQFVKRRFEFDSRRWLLIFTYNKIMYIQINTDQLYRPTLRILTQIPVSKHHYKRSRTN